MHDLLQCVDGSHDTTALAHPLGRIYQFLERHDFRSPHYAVFTTFIGVVVGVVVGRHAIVDVNLLTRL